MKTKRIPTININREDVKAIIKTATGTMFTVVFEKKDKTIRTLNGRLQVWKYTKGGVNTVAHIPDYMTMFDVNINDYRNVNVNRVTEMRIRGHRYVVK
jgi:cystathionine beta-lyase/cystathionine gamma-synthase